MSSGDFERLERRFSPRATWTAFLYGCLVLAAVTMSVVSASGPTGVFGACLAIVVLTIAFVDAQSFIIPDWLNAVGFALGLFCAMTQQTDVIWGAALALLRAGTLVLAFLLLRLLYARIRERQGLGMGDVKLAAVAGAWLDWGTLPVAIEVATLAALSTYVLRQLALGETLSATKRVPFGLFFAPAIWIGWILETTGSLPF
jgi:leader peptidase (prepilin peptidase)/N-methyltransferase